jgi:hypothetical protein
MNVDVDNEGVYEHTEDAEMWSLDSLKGGAKRLEEGEPWERVRTENRTGSSFAMVEELSGLSAAPLTVLWGHPVIPSRGGRAPRCIQELLGLSSSSDRQTTGVGVVELGNGTLSMR